METQLTLGEYVKRLRRARKWDLRQVSSATGLSVSHLSRIENDSAVPNPTTVVKLAKGLDGDLDQMLEMARCLPEEILQRLLSRASEDTTARRRSAGSAADPDYVRRLLEELDPPLRRALVTTFGLPSQDVDALNSVLGRLLTMPPEERKEVIAAISTLVMRFQG